MESRTSKLSLSGTATELNAMKHLCEEGLLEQLHSTNSTSTASLGYRPIHVIEAHAKITQKGRDILTPSS